MINYNVINFVISIFQNKLVKMDHTDAPTEFLFDMNQPNNRGSIGIHSF